MPRLLYVSTIAATLRRFIAPYGKYFRQQGWTVDAAANGVESDSICLDAFSNCFDIPFSRSMLNIGNITEARKRVAELLARHHYDLIHVHTPIASWVTRWVARKRPANQKLIYTAHGFHFHHQSSGLRNVAFRKLESMARRWMDHLIVINDEDYKNALSYSLANPESISLMRGIGIDLNEFSNKGLSSRRSRTRAQLNLTDDARMILMIAGFTRNKRHIDAIRGLAKMKRPNPYRLFFVGGGGEKIRAELKKTAIELKVDDRIQFLGFRNDIQDLLAAADLQLLISQREGLPRSVMEGMALGKTIIGTKIRGTTDLLDQGVGILIEPQSPGSLADTILDSEDFVPNAKVCRQRLQECRIENLLQAHHALYSRLLGLPANARRKPGTELSREDAS